MFIVVKKKNLRIQIFHIGISMYFYLLKNFEKCLSVSLSAGLSVGLFSTDIGGSMLGQGQNVRPVGIQ